MQFGIFSVGDITTDPTTGKTPTEYERIQAQIQIALKAEEVGLDVVALGQHHNPPFVASSPTTTMAYIAGKLRTSCSRLRPHSLQPQIRFESQKTTEPSSTSRVGGWI